MARQDLYHGVVKSALVKEGWTITHEPYLIKIEDVKYEIDMGAEVLIGAEKEGKKIAVEVKSFIEQSTVYAFHLAIGQFVDYLVALEETEPARVLYLAIPEAIFANFFSKQIIQKTLERVKARILVYDIENEIIVKWTN